MRGHQHVVERQQTRQHVVAHDAVRGILVEVGGLLLVDIETGRTDAPLLQPLDERLGMDELSAARVEQHNPRLHAGNRVGVNHVARLLGQRAVERDDIRAAVQLVKRDVGDARRPGILLVGTDVVGQHLHAEPLQNANQRPGDAARADDAGRLAVEVKAQQSVQREVAVARPPVGPVHLAVERQQQRHGVFGHGMGRIGRYADHADAARGRHLEVDVVEARAAQRNEPHPLVGQPPDGHSIGRIVDEDANSLGSACQNRIIGG